MHGICAFLPVKEMALHARTALTLRVTGMSEMSYMFVPGR
jgi:hypothetical protein